MLGSEFPSYTSSQTKFSNGNLLNACYTIFTYSHIKDLKIMNFFIYPTGSSVVILFLDFYGTPFPF